MLPYIIVVYDQTVCQIVVPMSQLQGQGNTAHMTKIHNRAIFFPGILICDDSLHDFVKTNRCIML